MKTIINKFRTILIAIKLLIKTIYNVYKYGGYTTVNICSINHGEILKGKNILITGGSSGIGLCIAKKCIDEGANVVITGTNETKLKQAFEEINNTQLNILVWDISQISKIENCIKETERLLNGDVDILINNAGVVSGDVFPYVTEEIWDKIYSVNSKGLFFLTQKFCDIWLNKNKSQLKKIINISSQGGFVGATYPYRMTKWDIAGLTQGLGVKLAPYGIIVNGIAPGFTATNMVPDSLTQKDNIYCSKNPLKRFALPEEIAELAIFLMSDGSNFIVGQTIICDGGYSIK